MASSFVMMPSPSRSPARNEPGARRRIMLIYLWRHGRLPNLVNPERFTELVQLRKLHDRDPRMPAMADKVAIKATVADRLGRDWVIPMLWSGEALPADRLCDHPVVVKSRHGCNHNVFVRDGGDDWTRAHAAANRWMARNYGWWLDEWLYTMIPRGILIEPLIGNGSDLPVDYKFYVFGGVATHVQVHLDRERDHRWVMHDMRWRTIADDAPSIPRPSALHAMAQAAEAMAQGFAFARVDFYQPDDRPLFGEISFYPGSGLDPFDPLVLDHDLGRLWLQALDRPCVRPGPATVDAPAIA